MEQATELARRQTQPRPASWEQPALLRRHAGIVAGLPRLPPLPQQREHLWRQRFEEFALSLHPDKTRLIEFGRHAAARRGKAGLGKPETFNFLGFTFICGRSRAGKFLVIRSAGPLTSRAAKRGGSVPTSSTF
jgi:hypothetical protein